MGVVLQQSELSPLLTVRETHRLFAGYFANPRDIDEVIELVGLVRETGCPRQVTVGRAEAATRPRRRARREPGARLPRRAHHGLRPGRAPGRVGADPLPPVARHDGPAHDPLPRRSAAARRSRRRAPRRGDRPSRVARRPDRGHAHDRDPLRARRRAHRRDDDRADSCAERADGRSARSGARPRADRGAPAQPRGRLPRLVGEEPE